VTFLEDYITFLAEGIFAGMLTLIGGVLLMAIILAVASFWKAVRK